MELKLEETRSAFLEVIGNLEDEEKKRTVVETEAAELRTAKDAVEREVEQVRVPAPAFYVQNCTRHSVWSIWFALGVPNAVLVPTLPLRNSL